MGRALTRKPAVKMYRSRARYRVKLVDAWMLCTRA